MYVLRLNKRDVLDEEAGLGVGVLPPESCVFDPRRRLGVEAEGLRVWVGWSAPDPSACGCGCRRNGRDAFFCKDLTKVDIVPGVITSDAERDMGSEEMRRCRGVYEGALGLASRVSRRVKG
jgi:hypothetical protein